MMKSCINYYQLSASLIFSISAIKFCLRSTFSKLTLNICRIFLTLHKISANLRDLKICGMYCGSRKTDNKFHFKEAIQRPVNNKCQEIKNNL